MSKPNKENNTKKITNALEDILKSALNHESTNKDEKDLKKSLREGLDGIFGIISEQMGYDTNIFKESEEMEQKVLSFINSLKGNSKFKKIAKDTHKLVILNNTTTPVISVKELIKECLYYRSSTIQEIINQTEFTGQGVLYIGEENDCKIIKKSLKNYMKQTSYLDDLKIKIVKL